MANAFNLTAQINLRGPTNLKPIVADIRRQLGSISANVNLNLDAKSAKGIEAVTNRLTAMNTILSQAKTNAEGLASTLQGLSSSLSSVQQNSSNVSSSIGSVSSSASTSSQNLTQASSAMAEFGKQSALAVKRFAAFSFVTTGVFALINAVNSATKSFIDFDKQTITLQQVTGKGAVGVRALTTEITRLATTYGVSSASLIEAATTLAQAGLSASETQTALEALAKTELAPSFDNMTQTTEGVIAAMRQFGLEAKDLDAALGSINAVSAAFAVEASDIIAAIQRTGGVFASASHGVSEGTDALNEFIAVFTSVRATTRESAETIATGLRTIFTRIQRASTIEALKEFGIELQDLDGKFVGPYEATKRLSEGLKMLDTRDIRFSGIVEELGGFRQIGKVIPLIQQFSTAQDALKVAQSGQASTAKDAVIAQQSLANQITKVREQFLALIRDVGQSSTFQGFFTIVTKLASGLISLASAFKPILPLLAIMGAVKGFNAITQFAGGFAGSFSKGGGAQAAGQNIGSSVTGNKDKEKADATSKAADAIISNTNALTSLTKTISVLDTNINSLSSAVNTNTSTIRGSSGGGASAGGTTLNKGGPVRKFATGGSIQRFAGGGVPALVSNGEGWVPPEQVASFGGYGALDRMNQADRNGMGKYSRGGGIGVFKGPGSGTSDNIKANLAVGGYVVRADAMTALGFNKGGSVGVKKSSVKSISSYDLGSMNRYAPGGLVSIKKLAQSSKGGSTISKTQEKNNDIIQDADEVFATEQREQIRLSQADKTYLFEQTLNDSSSKEGDKKTRFKSGTGNTKGLTFFNKQVWGPAFEDIIVKQSGGKWKTTSSNKDYGSSYPLDLYSSDGDFAEVKFTDKPVSYEHILNKKLRHKLSQPKDTWKFTQQKDSGPKAVDLGRALVYELAEGEKKRFTEEYRTGILEDPLTLANGGSVQRFEFGGEAEAVAKAQRRVGYIDYDVIANEANQAVVEKGMVATGSTGPRIYTDYLTQLAIQARKSQSLDKLRAIYGVAGAGKTTLARGQGTDSGTLRKTDRFPILSPEDIAKATEVLILSSSVSQDKMNSFFGDVDRAYTLSSTTPEERQAVKGRKASRDITGIGLENRQPGATAGVSTDSALGEAMLQDRLGEKSVVLARSESGKLRRKKGDELVEIIKKRIGVTWGGFAPTTLGHESIVDSAAAMGIPPEDFVALVGANEGIENNASSYRTAILDQSARVLIAKAGFGAKGATVLPKARDFEVPQAFDITKEGAKRRSVLLPDKGSTVFVGDDKTKKDTDKYENAGYEVSVGKRKAGVSGTIVRDLIASGNLDQLQSLVSPGVFDLLSKNMGRIQNRANILPSIVEQVAQSSSVSINEVEKQIEALGIKRIDSKRVASEPEYAAQVEVLKELREKKKKIQSSASFEPYRLLDLLAKSQPEKYALDLSTSSIMGDTEQGSQAPVPVGRVAQLAQEKNKSIQAVILEQLGALGGPAGVKKILGIGSGDRTLSSLLQAGNIKSGKGLDQAADYINQTLSAKGIKDAAEAQRLEEYQAKALHFGVAGLLPMDYKKEFEWDIGGTDVYATARGFGSTYLEEARQMQNESSALAQRFAENVQNKNIFGGGEKLAFDFDKTLVEDADILDAKGNPDIPKYSDRDVVQKALQKARPTRLAVKLKSLVEQDPSFIKKTRILTARPQSTADLLAQSLQSFGLPYAETDITGVSGGASSNIAALKAANLQKEEKLIDDNLDNIRAAQKAGKKGFQYFEPRSTTSELDEKMGQGNIEGAVIEKALAVLGAPVRADAKQNRAIDYPDGLGSAAQFFPGIDAGIPTEVKRTIDGTSLEKVREEIGRYISGGREAVKLASGGRLQRFAVGGAAQLTPPSLPSPPKKPDPNAQVKAIYQDKEMDAIKKKWPIGTKIAGGEWKLPGHKSVGVGQFAGDHKELTDFGGSGWKMRVDPKTDNDNILIADWFLKNKSLFSGYKIATNTDHPVWSAYVSKGTGPEIQKAAQKAQSDLGKFITLNQAYDTTDTMIPGTGISGRFEIRGDERSGTPRANEIVDTINERRKATTKYKKFYLLYKNSPGFANGFPSSTSGQGGVPGTNYFQWLMQTKKDAARNNSPERAKELQAAQDEEIKLIESVLKEKIPEYSFNSQQLSSPKTRLAPPPPAPPKRFAGGGSIPALVSNGEGWVPPEKIASFGGYGALDQMNQADRNGIGKYSRGGNIGVFKGPGSGTSDGIRTNLAVGGYVVRERAMKALGFNKGGSVGVRKFANGSPGGVGSQPLGDTDIERIANAGRKIGATYSTDVAKKVDAFYDKFGDSIPDPTAFDTLDQARKKIVDFILAADDELHSLGEDTLKAIKQVAHSALDELDTIEAERQASVPKSQPEDIQAQANTEYQTRVAAKRKEIEQQHSERYKKAPETGPGSKQLIKEQAQVQFLMAKDDIRKEVTTKYSPKNRQAESLNRVNDALDQVSPAENRSKPRQEAAVEDIAREAEATPPVREQSNEERLGSIREKLQKEADDKGISLRDHLSDLKKEQDQNPQTQEQQNKPAEASTSSAGGGNDTDKLKEQLDFLQKAKSKILQANNKSSASSGSSSSGSIDSLEKVLEKAYKELSSESSLGADDDRVQVGKEFADTLLGGGPKSGEELIKKFEEFGTKLSDKDKSELKSFSPARAEEFALKSKGNYNPGSMQLDALRTARSTIIGDLSMEESRKVDALPGKERVEAIRSHMNEEYNFGKTGKDLAKIANVRSQLEKAKSSSSSPSTPEDLHSAITGGKDFNKEVTSKLLDLSGSYPSIDTSKFSSDYSKFGKKVNDLGLIFTNDDSLEQAKSKIESALKILDDKTQDFSGAAKSVIGDVYRDMLENIKNIESGKNPIASSGGSSKVDTTAIDDQIAKVQQQIESLESSSSTTPPGDGGGSSPPGGGSSPPGGGSSPPGGGSSPPGGGSPPTPTIIDQLYKEENDKYNDNEFFEYKARKEGVTSKGYKQNIARQLGKAAYEVSDNYKGRTREMSYELAGRQESIASIGSTIEAAKEKSKTGTDEEKAVARQQLSDAQSRLAMEAENIAKSMRELNPSLDMGKVQDASKEIADLLSSGQLKEAQDKLVETLGNAPEGPEAMKIAMDQLAKQLGISKDILERNFGEGGLEAKEVKRQQFVQSREGKRYGALAEYAPDMVSKFSGTRTGKALGSGADFISGKGGKFSQLFSKMGGLTTIGASLSVAAEKFQKSVTITNPNTAGIVGGIGGAGSGLASGAALGAQVAGPVGALIAGISGAIIGGITGAFDGFNTKRLENNIKLVETSASDLNIALKKLAENASETNAAVVDAKSTKLLQDSGDLREQANLGRGGTARSAIEFLRAYDPTGISNSITGGTVEKEARDAFVGQTLVPYVDAQSSLGDFRRNKISTDQLQEVRSSIDARTKAAAETKDPAKIAEAEKLNREELLKSSQTVRQLIAPVSEGGKGHSLDEALITMGTTQRKKEGRDYEVDSKTAEGRAKLREEGAKLAAQEEDSKNRTLLLSRAMREMSIETDHLIETYRRAGAYITRFGDELEAFDAQLNNNINALRGQASVGPVDRSNEKILGNLSGYSNDEVKGAADRVAQLAGGGQAGTELGQQVQMNKVLQDELPQILKGATAENINEGDNSVMSQIKEALSVVGEPPKALLDEIEAKLRDKTAGKDGGTSLSDIGDDTGAFINSLKGAQAATNLSIALEKQYNDALQRTIGYQNEYGKALQEVADYQMQAKDIRLKGEIQLKEALGERMSLDEVNAPQEARIKGLTSSVVQGGTTDPGKILAAMQREIQNKPANEKDLEAKRQAYAASGAEPDKAAFEAQARLVAEQNNAINNSRKALEELAKDGTGAANALKGLAEQQKVAQGGVNFMQKVLTSDGAQLAEMDKSLQAYTKVITGKASNKELDSVKFRQQAFGGLSEISSMMPDSLKNQMQATLIENMAASSPGLSKVLDTKTGGTFFNEKSKQYEPMTYRSQLNMVKTGKDPIQQQYIDAYKEATAKQADAADRLGEAAQNVADELLKGMTDVLGQIKDNLSTAVDRAVADTTTPQTTPEPLVTDPTLVYSVDPNSIQAMKEALNIENIPLIWPAGADTSVNALTANIAALTTAIAVLSGAVIGLGALGVFKNVPGLNRIPGFGGGKGGAAATGAAATGAGKKGSKSGKSKGAPVSGTPASGTPASGTPASGTPASGTPTGKPAGKPSGRPGGGRPTGRPGSRRSARGGRGGSVFSTLAQIAIPAAVAYGVGAYASQSQVPSTQEPVTPEESGQDNNIPEDAFNISEAIINVQMATINIGNIAEGATPEEVFGASTPQQPALPKVKPETTSAVTEEGSSEVSLEEAPQQPSTTQMAMDMGAEVALPMMAVAGVDQALKRGLVQEGAGAATKTATGAATKTTAEMAAKAAAATATKGPVTGILSKLTALVPKKGLGPKSSIAGMIGLSALDAGVDAFGGAEEVFGQNGAQAYGTGRNVTGAALSFNPLMSAINLAVDTIRTPLSLLTDYKGTTEGYDLAGEQTLYDMDVKSKMLGGGMTGNTLGYLWQSVDEAATAFRSPVEGVTKLARASTQAGTQMYANAQLEAKNNKTLEDSKKTNTYGLDFSELTRAKDEASLKVRLSEAEKTGDTKEVTRLEQEIKSGQTTRVKARTGNNYLPNFMTGAGQDTDAYKTAVADLTQQEQFRANIIGATTENVKPVVEQQAVLPQAQIDAPTAQVLPEVQVETINSPLEDSGELSAGEGISFNDVAQGMLSGILPISEMSSSDVLQSSAEGIPNLQDLLPDFSLINDQGLGLLGDMNISLERILVALQKTGVSAQSVSGSTQEGLPAEIISLMDQKNLSTSERGTMAKLYEQISANMPGAGGGAFSIPPEIAKGFNSGIAGKGSDIIAPAMDLFKRAKTGGAGDLSSMISSNAPQADIEQYIRSSLDLLANPQPTTTGGPEEQKAYETTIASLQGKMNDLDEKSKYLRAGGFEQHKPELADIELKKAELQKTIGGISKPGPLTITPPSPERQAFAEEARALRQRQQMQTIGGSSPAVLQSAVQGISRNKMASPAPTTGSAVVGPVAPSPAMGPALPPANNRIDKFIANAQASQLEAAPSNTPTSPSQPVAPAAPLTPADLKAKKVASLKALQAARAKLSGLGKDGASFTDEDSAALEADVMSKDKEYKSATKEYGESQLSPANKAARERNKLRTKKEEAKKKLFAAQESQTNNMASSFSGQSINGMTDFGLVETAKVASAEKEYQSLQTSSQLAGGEKYNNKMAQNKTFGALTEASGNVENLEREHADSLGMSYGDLLADKEKIGTFRQSDKYKEAKQKESDARLAYRGVKDLPTAGDDFDKSGHRKNAGYAAMMDSRREAYLSKFRPEVREKMMTKAEKSARALSQAKSESQQPNSPSLLDPAVSAQFASAQTQRDTVSANTGTVASAFSRPLFRPGMTREESMTMDAQEIVPASGPVPTAVSQQQGLSGGLSGGPQGISYSIILEEASKQFLTNFGETLNNFGNNLQKMNTSPVSQGPVPTAVPASQISQQQNASSPSGGNASASGPSPSYSISLDESSKQFLNDFGNKLNNFGSYVQQLSSIHIPDKIQMTGTHTVDVKISGAAAIEALDERMKKLVYNAISEKMGKIWQQSGGQLGDSPSIPISKSASQA